ncbi:MAG TPA: bifunctional DNA-binding transcriptional regulator/O6-methylguanine-DNA methyltransferase Ada [Vicinamibacteria bacterium]|nr:bifunctional DNA-binding transcriptional regulator/O6-methylguanine-DNA methyltransferase Ada [Vicinamibacteria bacterium]
MTFPAPAPPAAGDDGDRWRAVLSRDRAQDGAFVYAVRSTGIYCRPSCPSRRPRRDRVSFFALPEAAEHAGFRPCLRCHPRQAVSADRTLQRLRAVCRFIEEHLEEPLPLGRLASAAGLSAHHLQRTFKAALGISPRDYADALRSRELRRRLRRGDAVSDAGYAAGYGSSRALYERAPAQLGMTPATYRKGGAGLSIAYATAASPLGRLLVAATGRGICLVGLGGSDAELEGLLRQEFPRADLERDERALRGYVAAVLDGLRGQEPLTALPLDVQATAFQWRVWQELQRIPRGSTRTYAEIARAIGQPGAARAVGQACNRNPVPLVIPCHRVVAADGALGGYRFGVERKRRLLDAEKEPASGAARDTRDRS